METEPATLSPHRSSLLVGKPTFLNSKAMVVLTSPNCGKNVWCDSCATSSMRNLPSLCP